MTQRVMLDACVLVPISLCDVLLDLADAQLFDPAWSQTVLDETKKALVEDRGLPPERAQTRIDQMVLAYPLSVISEFESLITTLVNHPKDRHVLAAAIKGECDLIVTANLRDFPAEALAPYNIRALHPDVFLIGLWRQHHDEILTAIKRKVARYENPPLTVNAFATILSPLVPGFARLLIDELGRTLS